MNEIGKDIVQFLTSRGFLEEKKAVGENESLTESGVIDSIGLLQLIDYLETRYKIEIPMDIITPENFDTLAGISQSVVQLKNT